MSKKKILYKEIKLHPSSWCLDIFICNDNELLALAFNKYFGASKEYYKEEGFGNYVASITSTKQSLNKGHRRIVMVLKSYIDYIFVHEIIHVLFHLSKNSGNEIKYKSQEWVAQMAEYIYINGSDLKTYSKI